MAAPHQPLPGNFYKFNFLIEVNIEGVPELGYPAQCFGLASGEVRWGTITMPDPALTKALWNDDGRNGLSSRRLQTPDDAVGAEESIGDLRLVFERILQVSPNGQFVVFALYSLRRIFDSLTDSRGESFIPQRLQSEHPALLPVSPMRSVNYRMQSNDECMLLEKLKSLETELHAIEVRRDRQRMERLLHPDFVEFGRSGKRYSRADILNEFGPTSELPTVRSTNYELAVLAEDVALLTYASAHEDADGKQSRHTLRSSVWVCTEIGWQIRFHQGTPAAA